MAFHGMNPYLATAVSFLIAVAALGVGILIFGMITRYQDWEEIKRGNIAVALAIGGLIIGLANIIRFAITSNTTPVEVIIWSGVGIVGLLLGWWLFDLFTPKFKTDDELCADNRAVGVVVFCIFIAISYIVGASIS